MRRARHWVMLAGLLAFAAAGPAQQRTASVDYREKYGVLSERNIFLRERGRHRRETPASRPAYTRSLEDSFVLRGMVFEDGQFRAYFENLTTFAVTKLTVGEVVANGKITRIGMDAVEFEQGGRPVRVAIGQTLGGGAATSVEAAFQELAGSATQPSGPPLDPNNPNLTTEQKMRLRRMQQMGNQ